MTTLPNFLLDLYQRRVIARELALLAIYRRKGRSPRMMHWVYWRYSFAPLVIGCLFVFCTQGLAMATPQATLVVLCAFIGLILADMQLFVLNAGTWIFARAVLDWRRVAELHGSYHGTVPNLARGGQQSRWDSIPVPPTYTKKLAKTYLHLRQSPPTLGQLVQQSGELRVLALTTSLTLVLLFLNSAFVGVTLIAYVFFVAWPAKRLKAALDFHFTWPLLQDAFDWEKIRFQSQ